MTFDYHYFVLHVFLNNMFVFLMEITSISLWFRSLVSAVGPTGSSLWRSNFIVQIYCSCKRCRLREIFFLIHLIVVVKCLPIRSTVVARVRLGVSTSCSGKKQDSHPKHLQWKYPVSVSSPRNSSIISEIYGIKQEDFVEEHLHPGDNRFKSLQCPLSTSTFFVILLRIFKRMMLRYLQVKIPW